MRIKVAGLKPGNYAEMRRENEHWSLYLDGEKVSIERNGPVYKDLKRDRYRLLGIESGVGRVIRFADLHRHSDCSLLDGMTKIPDMVMKTEYAGALTDHGVMYGFLEYYKAMKKAGKKAIIGFEAYMESLNGQLMGHHVVLLAKNEQGVKNLFKLTSGGYDNFRRKPHVTWQMLSQYHEGIICMSGCLKGIIPQALKEGNLQQARYAVKKFITIFGVDDFYIEIQRHKLHEEDRVRPLLIQLAKEFNVKVVATTDSHYPTKDDAYAHDVLLCLQMGKTIDDPDRMKFEGEGYHLMDSEEMETWFSDYPEALDNTLEIADKCKVDLTLNEVNLPKYTIPRKFKSPSDYMVHIAKKGYHDRFGGTVNETDQEYKERFEYEIEMIKQMGFESYFIIVWDFINFCRKENIYVGPGRGSAAGSLVAYCLGITDIDPIKYGLLFERFLNPERISWPDIDSDIEYSRRPEVISYMIKKYGAENVCRIVTFGTLAAKQAVRDVGRCLGKPASYTTKLSGMIPKGVGMTIHKAIEMAPELKHVYDSDQEARCIIDIAMRLEGNRRHSSQHACGLALSPTPVSDYLPTSMEVNDETGEKALTSQVIMTEVEELSLIKMDLLGLKNMGVIHEVMERIEKTRGKDNVLKMIGSNSGTVRYQDIPLNDRDTYRMLAKGLTGGVFQLESEGMTHLVQDLLADIETLPDERLDECFERIVAAVALYRPGPMDYIPEYLEGVKDTTKVRYDCPEEKPILSRTYGVMVYQEQLMQIARELAGYSLGEADILRKACGKKKKDMMDKEHERFVYGNRADYDAGKTKHLIPGCVQNGISEEAAEMIWTKMAKFAEYAFNRSHAVCYAYIGVITAYMACHWTQEFYAALLNAFIDNSEKIREYLSQASARGIQLLAPDINLSSCTFKAENGNIRFGLQGIIGIKVEAERIVEERQERGKFKSFQELYERMAARDERLNKKGLESLIYSGALSSFNTNKAAMIEMIPLLEKNEHCMAEARKMGQISLFGDIDNQIAIPDVVPMQPREELSHEREVLGMYLSRHPVDDLLEAVKRNSKYIVLEELAGGGIRNNVKTIGMVRNVRTFVTKKGYQMASFMLETRYAAMPCVVYSDMYEKILGTLHEEAVVAINGNVAPDNRGDGIQLIVKEMIDEVALRRRIVPVEVQVANKEEQDQVIRYVKMHPGTQIVVLVAPDGKRYPLRNLVESSESVTEEMMKKFRIRN